MLLEGGQGREQLLAGDVGVSMSPSQAEQKAPKNTFQHVRLVLCGPADLTPSGLLVLFSRDLAAGE